MTDIEAKALALVNEVRTEHGFAVSDSFDRDEYSINEVICRAIEQHEAFRQEVSDTLQEYIECFSPPSWHRIDQFIIPKPKPDPLVEVIKAMQAEPTTYVTSEVYANRINAALDALGFEIREKGQ
jgi:hypothetical protein